MIHQGNLCELTAHVVPFLARSAPVGVLPGDILQLLGVCAEHDTEDNWPANAVPGAVCCRLLRWIRTCE